MLRAALAMGADAGAAGADGETALHLAARAGDAESVRALLAAGARPDARHGRTGHTPLHEVCGSSAPPAQGEFAEAARALLEAGADPRALSARRQEPGHLRPSATVRAVLDGFKSRPTNKHNPAAAANAASAAASAQKYTTEQSSARQAAVAASNTGLRPSLASQLAPAAETISSPPQARTLSDRATRILEALEGLPPPVRDGSAGEAFAEVGGCGPADTLPPNVKAAVVAASMAGVGDGESAGLPACVNLADGGCECVPYLAPGVDLADGCQHECLDDIEGNGLDAGPEGEIIKPTGEDGVRADLINKSIANGKEGGVGGVGYLMCTEWDLRFTREFKEQLFSLRSNPVLLRSLLKNLQRLAAGEQGRHLMKLLKGTPKALRIFESPVKTFNDGGRFLWQYAVDYSPRIRGFTDTIRLWRVCLQHDDVPLAIDFIVASHRRGRTSSIKRHLQPIAPESCVRDGCRFPRSYKATEGVVPESLIREDAAKFEALTEEDMEDEAQDAGALVYTPPAVAAADSFNVLKFYALSDEVVRSIQRMMERPTDAEQLEFPFIPDEREDHLIQKDSKQRSSSILVVGRSGTGKTSIAVGRMWALYKQWHMQFSSPVQVDGVSMHYHQVFVTANRVLRDQVRKVFNGMKQGFSGAGVASESNLKYPNTFREIPESQFPLFLTQVEWLMMLDGTLDDPFFPRNEDGSVNGMRDGGFHEEVGMLDDIPADDDWSTDEDDMDFDFGQQKVDTSVKQRGEAHKSDVREGDQSKSRKTLGREIDFLVFREEIWPKLEASNKYDTKQLSASALFQEIHSYIKGSDAALKTSNGILSREEYLYLSQKMAPNFRGLAANESSRDVPGNRRGHRDLIYDLFLEYESEKRRMQAYDISDAVFHVWNRLQKTAYAGVQLHSIFVDEVQDFTPAELKLFIHVCSDKNDLFFSGDTCQTIASGVGFRFEDLKCLFKEEQNKCKFLQNQVQCTLPIAVPNVNVLSINYRTHSGILSVAAGIVDLLQHFFVNTIDVLPRESGFFDGPKPLMLLETKVDVATILIVGSDKKASQIEFGAHQVILVRNQQAKETLPSEFDGCLAMTILESKGLEFDDVFLWNFFADSRVSKEWRLVLTYLMQVDADKQEEEIAALAAEREKTSDSAVAGMLRPLDFDPHVHQILREELKHLYTAVTRARVRVVIYDQNEKKRAPMFYYLGRRGLIQPLSILCQQTTCTPLAVQTKPEEWRSRGMNLREMGMHQLAAMCFKNSGDSALEMESNGDVMAKRAIPLKGMERQINFFDAGELFFSAGKYEKASRCFYESQQHEIAGKLYMRCSATVKNESDAENLARHAFTCYRKAGKSKDAVKILVQQRKLKAALKILKDEQEYETAISVLDSNSYYIPPADLALVTFVKLAAVNHPATKALRNGTTDDLSEDYLKLLSRLPYEDEITQLKKFPSLHKNLVERLVDADRFTEAACVLEEHGDIIGGADLLLRRGMLTRNDLLLAVDLYTRYASTSPDTNESLKYLASARAKLAEMLGDAEVGQRQVTGSDGKLDRLHLLQLDLYIALRTSNSVQRKKALKRLIGSAQEQGCKVAEICAVNAMLSDVGVLPNGCNTQAPYSVIAEARYCISLLTSLLRGFGGGFAASLQDVLQTERFFGAFRQGCLLSWRSGRKALLDVWLGNSNSTLVNKKDGLVTWRLDAFHEILAKKLAELRLNVTKTIVTVLQSVSEFEGGMGSEMMYKLLLVWATNAGVQFLREGRAFLGSLDGSESFLALFNQHKLSEACERVVELSVGCNTNQTISDALQLAFFKSRPWRQAHEETVCALLTYTQKLWKYKKSAEGNIDRTMLFKVTGVMQGIGAYKELNSFLLDAAALTDAEYNCAADPSYSAEKKQLSSEIRMLVLAFSAFEKGDFFNQARYTLQLHLEDTNTQSACLRALQWTASEAAVCEALFALGVASRASYNAAVRSAAQPLRKGAVAGSAILLLPEFLIRKLRANDAKRRPVIPSKVESAVDLLLASLDYMCKLFGSSSAAMQAEYGSRLLVIFWTVIVNLLIAADPERIGMDAATCQWPHRATNLLQTTGQKLLETVAASGYNFEAESACIVFSTSITNGGILEKSGGVSSRKENLFKLQPLRTGGFPVASSPSRLWRVLSRCQPTSTLVLLSVSREPAAQSTNKHMGGVHISSGAVFVLSQLTVGGQELEKLDAATGRGLQQVRSQAALNPTVGDFVPSFLSNVADSDAVGAVSTNAEAEAVFEARVQMWRDQAVLRRSARIISRLFIRIRSMSKNKSQGLNVELNSVQDCSSGDAGMSATVASKWNPTEISGSTGHHHWWAQPGIWDPFSRSSRYSMFVVQRGFVHTSEARFDTISTHRTEFETTGKETVAEVSRGKSCGRSVQVRMGLWDLNQGHLVIDEGNSDFTEVILRLNVIKKVYHHEIVPALLALDQAYYLLEEASQSQQHGELQLIPEDAVALDMLLSNVIDAEKGLVKALGDADAVLWQPESNHHLDLNVRIASMTVSGEREGTALSWRANYPSLAEALDSVRQSLLQDAFELVHRLAQMRTIQQQLLQERSVDSVPWPTPLSADQTPSMALLSDRANKSAILQQDSCNSTIAGLHSVEDQSSATKPQIALGPQALSPEPKCATAIYYPDCRDLSQTGAPDSILYANRWQGPEGCALQWQVPFAAKKVHGTAASLNIPLNGNVYNPAAQPFTYMQQLNMAAQPVVTAHSPGPWQWRPHPVYYVADICNQSYQAFDSQGSNYLGDIVSANGSTSASCDENGCGSERVAPSKSKRAEQVQAETKRQGRGGSKNSSSLKPVSRSCPVSGDPTVAFMDRAADKAGPGWHQQEASGEGKRRRRRRHGIGEKVRLGGSNNLNGPGVVVGKNDCNGCSGEKGQLRSNSIDTGGAHLPKCGENRCSHCGDHCSCSRSCGDKEISNQVQEQARGNNTKTGVGRKADCDGSNRSSLKFGGCHGKGRGRNSNVKASGH